MEITQLLSILEEEVPCEDNFEGCIHLHEQCEAQEVKKKCQKTCNSCPGEIREKIITPILTVIKYLLY